MSQEDMSRLSVSVDLSKFLPSENLSNPDGESPQSASYTDAISNERISKGITLLDTYEVLSDAVRGGMGSVWKVHHNGWNKDLAMKRPQPRFFAEAGERRKARFVDECKAWIKLGLHPNIVSCYYVRDISGVPSIFSEWMENGSLEDRIKDRSLYEGTKETVRKRLLDIAIQFARGLHYAHETGSGLIHQDIKPDNLLLTNLWDAKVADFGLARARTQLQAGFGSVDMAGNPQGGGYTPAYCSPEQARGKRLTALTDIYSWAVSVMEMYLGCRPWTDQKDRPDTDDGKVSGLLAGKSCREYLRMEKGFPIPDKLKDLLAQCMSEDPADRPQSFAEIEQELVKIYEEETGRAYFRPSPKAASNTADSLNNIALSYLDLGQPEEAERALEEAILTEPEHVDARFNRELKLLREGKKFDFQVLTDLERIPAVKASGAAEAIAMECKGGSEPLPKFLYKGMRGSNLVLRSVIPVGEDICFSGLFRNPYSYNMDALGWFSRAGGEELELHSVRFDIKKDGTCHCALCADGKQAVLIMTDGSLRLYDLRAKTVLAQSDPIPGLAENDNNKLYFESKCSSGGGRLVLLKRKKFEEECTSFVIKVPELTLQRQLPMEFVGFLSDGRLLLRDQTKNALFTVTEEGELQEAFRFEREPKRKIEYCGDKGIFLMYTRTGEDPYCFYLDEQFRRKELPQEAFGKTEDILYYDSSQGLLCTKDSDQRFYFWDMNRQHCLYTVKYKNTYYERGHFFDEGSGRLLVWMTTSIMSTSAGCCLIPLPLPALPYDSIKAKWRLSGIMSSAERMTEDEKIAEGIRQFEESRKRGEIGEMARIHRECLEIQGFGGSLAASRMEDVLDRAAVKKSLRAVRSMGSFDMATPEVAKGAAGTATPEVAKGTAGTATPEVAKAEVAKAGMREIAEGEKFQIVLCGGGELIATYIEAKPEKGIHLYKRDGTFLRDVSLPDTAVFAVVRGNYILAFGRMLDAVKFDLYGNPVDPSRPAPTKYDPPKLNNDKKYGPPDLLAVDGDGTHILYFVNKPFNPFRKRMVMGFYSRDLCTGRDICLYGKFRENVRPYYLRDGSILFPMPTPKGAASFTLMRLSAQDGSVMMEYRTLPDYFLAAAEAAREAEAAAEAAEPDMWDVFDDELPKEEFKQAFQGVEAITPEHDQFLITAYYDGRKELRLFDIDGKMLGTWEERKMYNPFLLSGGRCICYGSDGFHVWDLQMQKEVFSEAASFSAKTFVYPDGRRVWRGNKLFRLEYDYIPDGDS